MQQTALLVAWQCRILGTVLGSAINRHVAGVAEPLNQVALLASRGFLRCDRGAHQRPKLQAATELLLLSSSLVTLYRTCRLLGGGGIGDLASYCRIEMPYFTSKRVDFAELLLLRLLLLSLRGASSILRVLFRLLIPHNRLAIRLRFCLFSLCLNFQRKMIIICYNSDLL